LLGLFGLRTYVSNTLFSLLVLNSLLSSSVPRPAGLSFETDPFFVLTQLSPTLVTESSPALFFMHVRTASHQSLCVSNLLLSNYLPPLHILRLLSDYQDLLSFVSPYIPSCSTKLSSDSWV